MANITMNAKIVSKNDTKANWSSKNPVLLKGEIGVEFDGSVVKFKIGDGTKAWNLLSYASNSEGEIIDVSSINGLGTVAVKDFGTSEGQIPILGVNGKLNDSIIPSLAITDSKVCASQAEMTGWATADIGDVAIRTDINKTFILNQKPASTISNWVELKTPTDVVTSVNGKVGIIVLSTTDIAEGTNLYFTETRATSNFNTNFANKSSTGLSDGADIVKITDTIIINGGNA